MTRLTAGLFAAVLVLLTDPYCAVGVEPRGAMLRYPDVSESYIVFLYANDLWVVPREGGLAVPLASPPGEESYPRFSPDGETIAFVGNYDGDVDLYTIPLAGGIPSRVTYHPANEVLSDWTPDGRLIFWAPGVIDYPRAQELFTISASGGLREKLPVPYGANASMSADGQWMAYTPHTRDTRTWKRYQGGMATDIWLFHLTQHTSKKITDWEGTDTQPMWHGRNIYYLSDAGAAHRLNIWVYDTSTGGKRQVTSYKDYDVKWPSIGPGPDGQGEIVFQYASDIHLLDLATEKARRIAVTIPGDRLSIRARSVDVKDLIFNRGVSPTGKRVVLEARGDVWTLPVKEGPPLDLTRTSGSAERSPAWSPDGKWIAFFSDESGEYELYITQSDGRGDTRRITSLRAGFLYQPTWSPDSEQICFWDKAGTLYLTSMAERKTRTVDRLVEMRRYQPVSWSSDSKWIAYSRADGMAAPHAIWLYNVANDAKHKVTSGKFDDTWPTFDREGKYLYFAGSRDFSDPLYDDMGITWIYSKTDRLYGVLLTQEMESPLLPESDDEQWADDSGTKGDRPKDEEEKAKGDEGSGSGAEDTAADGKKEPEPVNIDIEGFESRAILLPAERGLFGQLNVNDEGKLIYTSFPSPRENKKASIRMLDLKEKEDGKKEKTVVEGVQGYAMSGDGKKLAVWIDRNRMAIVNAEPDQKLEDIVPLDGMTVEIDPREEWRQIFREAWRIQRDYFYDPNMHGVDWEAVRRHYEPMLYDCATREDVSYVISEMISELNVGHATYHGGDVEKAPNVSVGMLGCDFTLENGAYRISRILKGAPWDVSDRGPLSQPGVDVRPGDYLLAVNGIPVDTTKEPWAAFAGLADRTAVLTVSEEPRMNDGVRRVLVKLQGDESQIRFRAWVEKNRHYVEEKTDGRVGYIYVPDTYISGLNELVRGFFSQLDTEALIIDERWNGGGDVPGRFVELLNRPIANYYALRDRDEGCPWPPDAHHGPKCMLINGLAGSGGDHFPYWFRAAGLGKLIGTRTIGGVIGVIGNPALIDGGYTRAPSFAFYEVDGTWGIEGHGVEPDIEVIDDPALMVDGKDPQLDAAIAHMLDELKTHPYKPPKPPKYPDRSSMGVRDEDR